MSRTSAGQSVQIAPRVEIDRTYGGVYAGTSFEFSPAVAEHFNRAAAEAENVLPGEFQRFEAGEHFSIACPVVGMPREQFIRAYHQLHARLDGDTEVRLGEFPRLFSTHPRNRSVVRGVPTYISESRFPGDFFGR